VIAATLVGCAGARPVFQQAREPSLIEVMDRLGRAQEAYRRIAEARNSVVDALGALELRVDVGPRLDIPNACPDPVRARAQRLREPPMVALPAWASEPEPRPRMLGRGVDRKREDRGERMTLSLYLLDAELERDGRGSLGCSR
jgi:hypothetical protein